MNILYLLAYVSTGFLVARSALNLWTSAAEGYGIGLETISFLSYVAVGLLLFAGGFGLLAHEKLSSGAMIGGPFVILPLTVVIVIMMMTGVGFVREISISVMDNPIAHNEGAIGYHEESTWVSILHSAYWMKEEKARVELSKLHTQQEQRSRLIKFSDSKSFIEIFGLPEARALLAFGEPVSREEQGEDVVRWNYYPWVDEPTWIMPVFVRNGVLIGIGEIHPAAYGEALTVTGEAQIAMESQVYNPAIINDNELVGAARVKIITQSGDQFVLQNTRCNYSRDSYEILHVSRCQDQYNEEWFLNESYVVKGVLYKEPELGEFLLPLEFMPSNS